MTRLLNYFQGGSHDGNVVETAELLRSRRHGWVGAYEWTPRIIVGSLSGREARVWRLKPEGCTDTQQS